MGYTEYKERAPALDQDQDPAQAVAVQPKQREWPRTFRALRHRNYRLFWTGNLISLIGTWMQSLAQQWLVYKLTGQAFSLGLVTAMMFLPVLLLSPFAGVLVDRVDKRRVIIGAQVAAMLLAFVLAGLTLSQVVRYWHIVTLAGLLGIVSAVDMPARQAFVPDIIDDRDDLMNAIALNSMVFNGARAIGPAIAGLIVGAVGEAWAFSLNGASYIAVLASLVLMRVPPPAARERRSTTAGRELLDGLAYARSTPVIRALLLLIAVPSIFAMSYTTLLPIFANEILQVVLLPGLDAGASRLGVLMTGQGAGALLGALYLARAGDRYRRGLLLLGGGLGFAVMLLVFSFVPWFWLALLLVAGAGFMMITMLATANTVLQTTSSDQFRGRVMSFYTTTLVGLGMIGSLLAGAAADWVGAPLATRIGALICLAAMLLSLRSGVLRNA